MSMFHFISFYFSIQLFCPKQFASIHLLKVLHTFSFPTLCCFFSTTSAIHQKIIEKYYNIRILATKKRNGSKSLQNSSQISCCLRSTLTHTHTHSLIIVLFPFFFLRLFYLLYQIFHFSIQEMEMKKKTKGGKLKMTIHLKLFKLEMNLFVLYVAKNLISVNDENCQIQ